MAAAVASGLAQLGGLFLTIRERLQILKEVNKDAEFAYNVMGRLRPILEKLTDNDEAQVFIGQLEEVNENLEALLLAVEGPSIFQRFKRLVTQPQKKEELTALYESVKNVITQPAKKRELDGIYRKLTMCLLCILTSQIQDTKQAIFQKLEQNREQSTQGMN